MATAPLSAILVQDRYCRHVLARLADFFADTAPWPRRLWQVSSVLALEEAAEAGTWLSNRALSTEAMSWYLRSIQRQLGPDLGLGDSGLRREVNALLGSALAPKSRERRRLIELIPLGRQDYLKRWAGAIASGKAVSAERLARAIATHLLDCGHSSGSLHRWARAWLGWPDATLGDLLSSANAVAQQGDKEFAVLVPFIAVPDAHLAEHLPEWVPAARVSQWLTDNGFEPVRNSGAFLYTVTAKDAVAAARLVGASIRRLETRRSFSRGKQRSLRPVGSVWVDAHPTPLPLRPPERGVAVLALERERIVYAAGGGSRERLDEALELAGALNSGPAASAVAGAWAAIESLLFEPGDEGDKADGRAVAASRMATVVACSWPRAELTPLSRRHRPAQADDTSMALGNSATNLERCDVVAEAISSAGGLALEDDTDIAAENRMRDVLANSQSQLNDAALTFEAAFRRLYRQRNIVVHGGSTGSIGLEPALRIVAPLFGAGMDRLFHAQLTEGLQPLELAARAENSLALVGDQDGPKLTRLLEPRPAP